jgi:hypothetical protein
VQIHNRPHVKDQTHSALLVSNSPAIIEFPTDDQRKAAKHREIADRHKRGKHAPPNSVRVLRELRKVFADRYDAHGPAMPEGDDGALDDFLILLNYVAMLGDYGALCTARARWAPWLDDAAFDAIVAEAVHSPLYLSPDALGERIGLSDAKRTELKIRSIGCVGWTAAERKARSEAKEAANQKAKRAAVRAARPASATETKPWIAHGMGRSTYYAKIKTGWTPVETAKLEAWTKAERHKLSYYYVFQ